MKYLSICSGIEAATVAWHHMGWESVGFAEIDKFPAQVLRHHYHEVPNFGDLTKHDTWPLESGSVDLLVGGTPCQDFSIAGLRAGMAGERGALTLEFVRLAARLLPRWIVWENVPGVLSSNRGRDFGTFLGALAQLGYGFAYRVLDAQYFGVAQRRRRVFVVGYLGDWRAAGAVLFEPESLRRHPAESRKARKGSASPAVAGTLPSRHAVAGHLISAWPAEIACTLNARYGDKQGLEDQHALGGASLFVPAVGTDCYNGAITGDVAATLGTPGSSVNRSGPTVMQPVATVMQVRRLTPVECERLQGFPDDYTAITYRGKPAADSPRYKALGNSMAVPVMRWIGEQIRKVEEIK